MKLLSLKNIQFSRLSVDTAITADMLVLYYFTGGAIDGMDNGWWAVLRWFCIYYVIGVIRVKFFDWNTCHLQGIEACQTDMTMTHNSNRSREKSGQ